ncbi:MAG TPA: hypothetical protein VJ849_02320, partial [Actinomycetes bacterium]|nr:hypothetical protein [Actinomycetes bacterium]
PAIPVQATATVPPAVQTVAPVNVPIPPAQPVPAIAAVATATPKRTSPASKPRTTVTASVPAAAINPKTGQPYSVRHQRRLLTGK